MNEREFLANSEGKSFVFSSFYKVLVVILVIFSALFIGKILFGTRSLEVFLKLKGEEENLQKTIKYKEIENEKLQKKLFEYQLATPDLSSE